MQEEVTQKTVTFCIRATKITADLLKKVLAAYPVSYTHLTLPTTSRV